MIRHHLLSAFFPLLELQKLKAQVVTEIRSNQQLEHDLQGMDTKIGLLVRNKITLQVSLAHLTLY